MGVFMKWILGTLLAGLVWLVTRYTVEYFRPYKKIPAYLREKG